MEPAHRARAARRSVWTGRMRAECRKRFRRGTPRLAMTSRDSASTTSFATSLRANSISLHILHKGGEARNLFRIDQHSKERHLVDAIHAGMQVLV
mmetsp:Transcript_137959/g.440627  ORF Transcript_137959/g.440627 Transcript_137959/m.440627 type:complete len:95 (-) Transcript_137959:337-621(-)